MEALRPYFRELRERVERGRLLRALFEDPERERRELEQRRRTQQDEQQEQERRERLARRAQLQQQLESPPGACTGGLSLNHLSSLLFLLVLAAAALELVGWFMFLGLLVTILAYLLLIILPAAVLGAKAHMPRVASLVAGYMDTRCSPRSRLSSGIWRV
ncbi:hypothetical protein C8R44DRAFT_870644 [Mycena epipterygia]|nr:hypothetical protein C8R44DRAFT_870644 [Mycena epipterygia]